MSVVLPCYNRSALLARAIDSALGQGGYASQVIVVDDGSTDNTKEVCARYGSHIEYIWQANAGPSMARNVGVNYARNPWVAFLDSDDYWTSSHLARIAKAIDETRGEACFYFSDMQMGEGNNCTKLWQMINFVPPRPVHLTRNGTNWVFLAQQPTMLQCSVFRRDAWKESGGLDPRFHLRHDTELFCRLGIEGKICAVSGVGCVRTEDDISDVRLTTAVHPSTAAHWEETIMMWRSLLRRFPNLPPKYRRIARFHLASAHWRLIRTYWSSRKLSRSIWHLPMVGWVDPLFALSLLAHRRSDANRPAVFPEYE